jgi:hypothetical protein
VAVGWGADGRVVDEHLEEIVIQTVDQLVGKMHPEVFLTHSPTQQGDLLCWAYNAAMAGNIESRRVVAAARILHDSGLLGDDLRSACADVAGCE